VLAAEKNAIAIEQWVLKEADREALEDEKAQEQARKGITRQKEKKKRKTSKPKPPTEVFETACFRFIQGAAMDEFMTTLPSDFGEDRLFCILIAQALFRLVRHWMADAINTVPKDIMPQILPSREANNKGQVVVSVDTDSEVHRFVASAVRVYRMPAAKRLKILKRAAKERKTALRAPRASHTRNIRTMEGATNLLNMMGILRKDIPERHDKSYDSRVLEAMNRGGHLYVSPPFLKWAKLLMTKVRASVTVGVIRSLGNNTQVKGYEHLLRKENGLEQELKKVVAGKNIDEAAIFWVFERIVDYAFHARTAVEWRKYQAEMTDRTSGKEKKMSVREKLKGGATVKQEAE
jgi:hypothetical protein